MWGECVLVPVLVGLAVLRYEKQSLQKQSLQPSDTCIWGQRLGSGDEPAPFGGSKVTPKKCPGLSPVSQDAGVGTEPCAEGATPALCASVFPWGPALGTEHSGSLPLDAPVHPWEDVIWGETRSWGPRMDPESHHLVCPPELCPRHSPLDPTPHTVLQPISAALATDSASCPHCQPQMAPGSPDSGQEGSGGSGGSTEDEADGEGARSSEDRASSGLGKEDEEEQAAAATRLCGRMWWETRAKLRGIVDSKYFNRGIMTAILVNTVSMGIEHHEQASNHRPLSSRRSARTILMSPQG